MSESEMTGNLFLLANAAAASSSAPVAETMRAEARLVERVCQGDGAAFDEIYKIYAPLIHGIVLARVPRDEAADLVQEVFLAAYKNLSDLRDKNAFGAWISMIARNRATEFHRQAKPTEDLTDDFQARTGAPETEAREILATIRRLPEAYRETLIWRLVEGMTGPEIAERCGLTPESVRVNLHRGMKLLRQRLGITEK